MATYVAGQRVQHLAVLQRRPHIAFAQQICQVVEVSTEGREVDVVGDEGGEVIGAAGAAYQHRRNIGNRPSWVGTTRQARCARACRELLGIFECRADLLAALEVTQPEPAL